jgi:FdhD protein
MTLTQQGVASLPVYTFNGRGFSKKNADIIREIPLKIIVNDRLLVTIACTGIYTDELALGYLKSEGLIRSVSDVRDIRVDPQAGAVHLVTAPTVGSERANDPFSGLIGSSGARGRIDNDRFSPFDPTGPGGIRLSPEQILQLTDAFIGLCRLHAGTRGTHGAAFTDGREILVVREDIGRHNAIDMLAGYALLHQLDCSDKAVLRTGRVSTEIVFKAWNLGIPVIVSLAVPTTRAIELASEAGMTIIGAVRDGCMNVYTHERRIGL